MYIDSPGIRAMRQVCAEDPSKAQRRLDGLRDYFASPSRVEMSRAKAKATCLRLYGATSYAGTEIYQKRMTELCLEEHGVPHRFQSSDFKAKSKATMQRRYGVSNSSQLSRKPWSPSKKEMAKTRREATMLANHGVRCSAHSPDILTKIQASRFKQKTFDIDGRTFTGLLGYEPQALNYLVNTRGVRATSIVSGLKKTRSFTYKHKGKDRKYYPDFEIPASNLVVEVKSEWTLKRDLPTLAAKIHAVTSSGSRLLLLVLDKSRVLTTRMFHPS